MTQHPITPPFDLVQQWDREWRAEQSAPVIGWSANLLAFVAARAAQWGADQELEACCEWIADWYGHGCNEVIGNLRTDRRPKPPSLKEQALQELEQLRGDANSMGMGFDAPAIRRALEQLDD